MKINLLKGFAAVAMLCMVGAVLAEPISTGNIGVVAYELASHEGSWDTAHSIAAMEGVFSCTELAGITVAVAATGGLAAIPLAIGTGIC
jgi:hypothetical protein